jgi:NAD(P)-dependent dehydrogenase (short-subunit alcohol dehydrogenase family)
MFERPQFWQPAGSENPMEEYADQIVLITGAAGALGSVVAHAYADAGAAVVLFDNHADRLQQACGDLAASPRNLAVGSVDLTQAESVDNALATAIDHVGRIDSLINIAGGYRAGDPLHETSLDTWEFMLNLNARSVFLMCRSVVPHMLEKGGGKIVNIGARPGLKGAKNAAAYSAAKSAVIRITESLSAEGKERGIRVNCILPGTIDTQRNREAMPDVNPAMWVQPRELTNVIMFLTSEHASGIHGAAIPVYGLS